jgi:hypothetical protein
MKSNREFRALSLRRCASRLARESSWPGDNLNIKVTDHAILSARLRAGDSATPKEQYPECQFSRICPCGSRVRGRYTGFGYSREARSGGPPISQPNLPVSRVGECVMGAEVRQVFGLTSCVRLQSSVPDNALFTYETLALTGSGSIPLVTINSQAGYSITT